MSGNFVRVRYATTQRGSHSGDMWRSVRVIHTGKLGEYDMVTRGDFDAPGWWVTQCGVKKFFLKSRILDVQPIGL